MVQQQSLPDKSIKIDSLDYQRPIKQTIIAQFSDIISQIDLSKPNIARSKIGKRS